MNYSFLMILFLALLVNSASSCSKKEGDISTENDNVMAPNGKIKIKVNAQTFTATLLDNNSAKAFKEMLPLTINMTELNGNEKYYDLSNSLSTNSSNPGSIKNGELMLYGSKTLVLFYKIFSTPYSYTKLGMIDDVTGLTSALGSGNSTVSFELE
ncbi:cyclophilin-like fold protein [Persicitalea sp.]|uniref:cyclophilin-like fold protein n=1 Tax=Persicitalea sp. TaxID=3100273 RepID=UPI0035947344